MTEEQKKKLEQKLWDIANELRGRMDADDFRDYILGFIFYKYLSERLHLYIDQELLKSEGLTFSALDESDAVHVGMLTAVKEACIESLGYYLPPRELFSAVAQRGSEPGSFILADLAETLNNIQQSTMGNESEEDFVNLFEDLDLNSSKLGRSNEARNALISKVLVHLDAIDFQLESADSDVLGDAYEYLIGKFASGAGKKAGEFYTPQEVSTVLAKIVTTGKARLRSVYDPTCGSGSLLLRVAREVGEKNIADFYGQELNRTTYNLARMNMILHGVHYSKFDIEQEDTLELPQHEGMTFEAIVANPPFSAKWSANKVFESDDRFAEYGRLAPASKADFAFVQHMLHHLDEDGTMAVILPHGVLFRGGAEGAIREFLIRRNWLDSVIGLPENIFYGTAIPTCILVLKKCKETEDVFFVDASTCFERGKNQNTLGQGDVERIVQAYRTRAEEERFSHRALLAEIEENDFNLNIPRYVDTFVPESPVDLEKVTRCIEQINLDMRDVDEELRGFCAELGLEAPL
ncbi:type I restriction-modification system subunit M [uncultured Litoreibacter sp.]|uniref:type I restriction-modification system subunit M n=1 Tax=uncultured Litoreibacter sp. TaxID=1392394 RepID=UPI002605F8E1|nr:type I restriction-modification system subunit M [uncultured Litoreibacter sp.]